MSVAPENLAGRVLDGRYRVEAVLATGGMSTVYYAWDLRLQRTVAVKVMHAILAQDAAYVLRFEREARSAAALSHPNVVGLHDAGRDEETGAVFLVMELVPGHTLRDVLNDRRSLSPAQALGVMDPVLQALSAAHRAGFVHRDIKPENVIIADDGRVKVADFGLARATTDNDTNAATRGVLIGTVAYLSPEQVSNGAADPRSDIYSSGIVLFELLTGNVPFAADTPIAVAFQHVHNEVPAPSTLRPGLPPALDRLVLTATRRDPEERYQDVDSMLRDLRMIRQSVDGFQAESATVSDWRQTDIIPNPSRPKSGPRIQPAATETAEITQPAIPVANRRDTVEAKPKRKWRSRIISITLVLALIGGWLGYSATRTSVPQLVGQNLTAAEQDLEAADLQVEVRKVFSNQVPAGVVISADPVSGSGLSRGSVVTLEVSKGPESLPLPDLVGMTPEDAAAALSDLEFAIGGTDKAYSDKYGKGIVVATDPVAGTPLRPGATVDLTLSKGAAPVAIPDVVGKKQDAATAMLISAGFTNLEIKREFSNSIPAGKVIGTSPAAGVEKLTGAKIQVVVSDGPPPVAVPNVVGKTKSAAEAALLAVGLQPVVASTNKCKKPLKAKSKIVQQQLVTAGTLVAKGTQVGLGIYVYCS